MSVYQRTILIFCFLLGFPFGVKAQGISDKLPFYKEVMNIMSPLQYSGLDTIIGEDADLNIDFNKKIWILKNAYHYGKDGHIRLEGGNRGLCGALAKFVYWRIKPIFASQRYEIKICVVKEKSYFFTQAATHIVLLVVDKNSANEYVIDPSFKRYIVKGTSDDYEFLSENNPQKFIEVNKLIDKPFYVNYSSPLLIKDNYLLSFAVETVNGKFDPNNFVLALKASYKRSNVSHYIFVLCLYKGKVRIEKDSQLLAKLLGPQERDDCLQRIFKWSGQSTLWKGMSV